MHLSDVLSSNSLAGAVLLALLGAALAYWNASVSARRKDRLDLVGNQLQLFYGPLYALATACDAAWNGFHTKYWPDRDSFFSGGRRTPEELDMWQAWITQIFMPMTTKMVAILSEYSHLARGAELPASFSDLIKHVAGYEYASTLWPRLNPAAMTDAQIVLYYTSVNPYPVGIVDDVRSGYVAARAEQQQLLSKIL
jgi:hypothetical protein